MKPIILSLLSFCAIAASPDVEVYFNQNQSHSFVEPYRGLERSGDDFEAKILPKIMNAKSRVWVAMHEFRLPNIAAALILKKKEGVDVRVILENQYSAPFPFRLATELDTLPPMEAARNREYFYYIDESHDGVISDNERVHRDVPSLLRTEGIAVIDDTADGSKGSGLMHHKFLLIDNTNVVVSSANFTWSDFYGDILNTDTRGNANFLMLLGSPQLNRYFETEFLEMWQQKKFGVKKTYRGSQSIQIAGKPAWVQFAPTGKRFPWEQTALGGVDKMLSQASKSIDIGQFVFSEQEISNTLEDWKKKTGGLLRVLIDSAFAFQDYSEVLDIFGLKMLNRFCKFEKNNRPWSTPHFSNIGTPRLVKGDKYHHKFAVIDNRWVLFGSLNWSASGNHENDETIMALESPEIAQAFTTEFERSLSNSWKGVPPWLEDKIKEREKKCSGGSPSL